MTFSIAVAGCTGYAGGELLRLLAGHPNARIGALTGNSSVGDKLGNHQPHLAALAERVVEPTTAETLAGHDVVFLALPHGASAPIARELGEDVLVIDSGADFRLSDPAAWQRFYGTEHAGTWPYGLPELPGQRAVLRQAKRIAVPGCYPTAVTLAFLPAVAQGMVDAGQLNVVAVSGTSGAGRSLKPHLLGSEVMGNVLPYAVGGGHRHIPEIIQNLSGVASGPVGLSFTPLLAPMSRGILATCSAPLVGDPKLVRPAYEAWCADEPFVELLPEGRWPMTAAVLGSNRVSLQITVDQAADRVIVCAAIDNLSKGTAGGAIQSMNIALGLDESIGLSGNGVAP